MDAERRHAAGNGETETGGAPDPDTVRARDRRHVWHTWSPLSADRSRLTLARGRGYRVWDIDGREYIDAASLNTVCGYAHPHVAEAVGRQLGRLHQFDLSLASHEPAGLLAERLSSYLPEQFAKTLFVNSGSEGIEAAVVIADGYWAHLGRPRRRVVTFARGYHGSTVINRSLSGLPRVRHAFSPALPVTHVDLPVPPGELHRPESLAPLLSAFERALCADADDPPMAVLVEPFLNVGGGVVLPPGFLKGLSELCAATGTLLILDEVFTAFGRTGRMFACQREEVLPDILVTSKGLSGGYVPIAAVTVHQRVHDTFRADPVIGGLRYGHTTSGHPVACAAALATLDVVEREGLAERAERLGARLRDRLGALAGTGEVTDVRGLGLVLVVELSSAEAAAGLVSRAEGLGLLLRQPGEAVMAVPSLTIDEEGAETVADLLEQAVAKGAS
ncbi:aspartate aminotransferase family protein [Streptomyces hoynatensis]|uniref:Aspartate aminotransferase family protein n=1 Tax=Streptomyces hoynatensis TaxID=1141874 RepID=A0A3A9Z8T5_9ACTN|nr:aminotransferase class III-fold pyridoxal phosphate-dependent enzyme [Streptomyces hoynatensis]RKN44892.1 aspartate aminotransferase family protein [Streptomyces hoynatensis]